MFLQALLHTKLQEEMASHPNQISLTDQVEYLAEIVGFVSCTKL